jgi:tetratricopeptide (TPR) repeat protein
LRRVVEEPDEHLDQMLSELQMAEFIYEQPASSDIEYTFKHALTQEVAYNSILVERRKMLHERTAAVLEALHADDRADYVGELARHYHRSENAQKAVEYLTLAGEKAAARSALAEATGYLMSGLQTVSLLPDTHERDQRELRLQLALAVVQSATGGWSAAERFQSLERAYELCDRTGNGVEAFPVLWQLCQACMGAGRYSQAAELAERSIHIAEHEGESTELMLAHYNLAELDFRTGNFDSSRHHTRRALELYGYDQHACLVGSYGVDFRVLAFGFSAWNGCYAGFLDQALKDAELAVKHARMLNHPYSLTGALMFLSFVHYYRGEPEPAKKTAAQTIALSAEVHFRSGMRMRECPTDGHWRRWEDRRRVFLREANRLEGCIRLEFNILRTRWGR